MHHALRPGAALLALATLLLGAVAGAQPRSEPTAVAAAEPTRIVLVASPGMDELANRFVAELSSLRFDVVRAPDSDAVTSTPELEALAEQQAARVAVRVASSGGAIDLWVVNPVSRDVVYRRVIADRDPAVAVLRSLEILRGALIDVRALEPPPEPPPPEPVAPKPAPPPAPPPPPARPGVFAFSLGAAALWPRAGSELGWGALAGLHRAVGSRFALHAAGLVPVGEWRVVGEGGQAKVWAGSLLLAASVLPWGERAFTPSLGLGVGALALHTRGEAQPGFRGTSDLNLSAFPHGRLGATLALGGPVRLRAEALAGFATPRPVLLFAEQRDSGWINPLLIGSLGLELALR